MSWVQRFWTIWAGVLAGWSACGCLWSFTLDQRGWDVVGAALCVAFLALAWQLSSPLKDTEKES